MLRVVKLGRFCALAISLTVLVGGCLNSKPSQPGQPGDKPASAGGSATILIDGSSTVFRISQAMSEEYGKTHSDVKIPVGTSGTGGGFKKFVIGETAINDASRPIKAEEAAKCKENGIEYLELKIAIDGLSVVVHPENDWCTCLTVDQLKKLWEPESKVKKWNELDPAWPDEEIKLFGADTESGTFDYFTEAINGKEGASRADYTPSSDDNVLVQGIAGEKYALGYFGYAYYEENKDKLKIVAITGKDVECVTPTPETIQDGTYRPLARPLFLYVNKAELKRPEVAEFLKFYLGEGQPLVAEAGYIQLKSETLEASRKALEEALAPAATAEAK